MRTWIGVLSSLGVWLCTAAESVAQTPSVKASNRSTVQATPASEPRLVVLPQKIPSPEHNPTTQAKIALGQQLFFDTRLSGDNTMSCATCHLPEKAFGDGRARGKGHGGKTLRRNTPSLLNVGYLRKFTWDGRAPSLEAQAWGPITAPDEMKQDPEELVQELGELPGYVEQFRKIFGTNVSMDGVVKSLSAFQRTLITKPAPLDKYLRGDKSALTVAAKRGMELFVGEAGCIRCHHGPLLTDHEPHRLRFTTNDLGLEEITGKKEDRYRFRTPPLRNIAQTGPYMHDGAFETLFDVVTFYFREVPTTKRDGLTLDVAPLFGQSFSEIADIVAFLEALTGEVPPIQPPRLP